MGRYIGNKTGDAVKMPCGTPAANDVLRVGATPSAGEWGKLIDANVDPDRSLVTSNVVDASKNINFASGTGWANKNLDNLEDGASFKKVAGVNGGQVTTASIASGAVGTSQLESGAVTSAILATGAVASSNIASGAVGSAAIASGAVDTAALAPGAVTATKIGAGQVDSAALGALAVTSAKISAGAVDSSAIGSGAVTDAKLSAITGTNFIGGSGALGKLDSSGRLVDPIIKDTVGSAHRKLKNQSGKFVATDDSDVAVPARFAAIEVADTLSVTKTHSDGMPYATVVDRATTNYITNPSFEVDLTGWTTYAGGGGATPTLTRDTSSYQFGTASMKIDSDDSDGGVAIGARLATAAAPVAVAGENWAASAWVRMGSGTQLVTVLVEFWNSSDVFLSQGFRSAYVSTAWMPIAAVATAPANTAKVLIYVFASQSTQAFDLYVDATQLEKGATASSYCDGSLGAGYAWTGAANASTSTRDGGIRSLGSMDTDGVPFTILDNGAIHGVGMVPVGAIVAWHDLTGTGGSPSAGWVRCDGQTLSNVDSPFNGRTIPDLNGALTPFVGLFVRGAATSGTTVAQNIAGHAHGLGSHTHSLQAHTHSMQGHEHNQTVNNSGSGGVGIADGASNTTGTETTAPGARTGASLVSSTGGPSSASTGTPSTSETNTTGTGIGGGSTTETYPRHFTVVWIMRVL